MGQGHMQVVSDVFPHLSCLPSSPHCSLHSLSLLLASYSLPLIIPHVHQPSCSPSLTPSPMSLHTVTFHNTHVTLLTNSSYQQCSILSIPPLHVTLPADPNATHELTSTEDKFKLLVNIFPLKPTHVPNLPGDTDPLHTPLPFAMPLLNQVHQCILK